MDDFVRLTANAGILIRYHGKKILVDALHNRYTEVFSSVPDDLLFDIAHGKGDFADVDLIVYTHDHPDHYSREWTKEFLKNHPGTCLISPIDDFSGDNVVVLKEAHETHLRKGINIEALRLVHEGARFRDVVNYGFRFEIDGFSMTVLGDSGLENIPSLFAHADLGFYNFPFMTVRRGKQMIEELAPKRIIAYHLPFESKDQSGYIKSTLRSIEHNGYEGATVLWKKNQKEPI